MEIPADKKYSQPSEEFMDAVTHFGTGVIDCDLCGRVHFAPDAGYDFSEGELERLSKDEKSNPEKYINHGDESISWGTLDGKQVVSGCPCNRAKAYEQLFWQSRRIIAEYFLKKASLTAEESKNQARIAQDISKVANSE